MKYCDFNGCINKIDKERYCINHKRSKPRKKKDKKNIYHHENKSFYNSDVWKFARSQVYEREKGKCQRCGRFVFGRSAHVHHIISVRQDQTLKLELNNLMLLCPKCHIEEENEGKPKKVFPSYFG
ncbi:HNH endonuclease [Priestia taiwanensis]|uniref:Putative HNH nuclease YajD n=1 Tax=Priestia taiwanensis TaxID=1347902 RepID=A0A917AKQ3_9BACI|nr:HNH endonuclease signature motif containing protein [Priestia taiwanensis]MBM7361984.1 5-methylcytosine-specific restriction endonuclease McrA [Priestia taiwanensis]GGE58517.1 HNH endonuclease [Priestia taiwanensis]